MVCWHVQKSRKGTSAGSLFPQIEVEVPSFSSSHASGPNYAETFELSNGDASNGKINPRYCHVR